MRIPVSWLKEFVDIDVPVEILAEQLTLAGLEVAHIYYIGVPQQHFENVRWPTSDHLVWDREKVLLGAIREVKAHPDADKLVLAMVDYGADELEQCVTGAPNLYEYKDKGPLDTPLWTAFALEGAELWDGHSETPKRLKLKGRKLRGIYNKSMVCSEKELGISDEHEGIILLENREGFAPGTPLQDVLGDVVLDIELTPNLARCFSVLGVAREIAALLNKDLREPSYDYLAEGSPIEGQAFIEIREPSLNPRFTLALLRDTEIKPSPEWMQRRLRLVGQRPINNIVDVTNYITFEIGQPLHAFDYDKLVERAGGNPPTIITRLPEAGETLTTLDEVERELEPHNILVCDTAGVLSLGGVIGGAETEISESTRNVLLEAANWDLYNIRKTTRTQKVHTDAATRFSRGVHPSQAILGVQRGIELMRQLGGGQIAQGILDAYPNPPQPVEVTLSEAEIHRLLGIELPLETAAEMLQRLQFEVAVSGDSLTAVVPDHRMDINDDPIIGQADLVEEIARIYGYDRIPNTIMADEMPPQRANVALEREELARDILVDLGLREIISYRFANPEHEALLTPPGAESSLPQADYVRIINPPTEDRTVLRHTLLVSLLDALANNIRFTSRVQIFEIGSIYLRHQGQELPDEPRRLGILLTGPREKESWLGGDTSPVDFYDMKGVIEGLIAGLHIDGAEFVRGTHTSFHPGRSADLLVNGQYAGTFGELHPRVAMALELDGIDPIYLAELDLEVLLAHLNDRHPVKPLPETPPVLQDIAMLVPVDMPAAEVETVIRKAGGRLLDEVELFDVYQGDNIEAGYKSLAYHLTYRDMERTLTDKEVAKVHKRIMSSVEKQLGAKVRK